jgi:hypothetical protein
MTATSARHPRTVLRIVALAVLLATGMLTALPSNKRCDAIPEPRPLLDPA